MSCEQLSTENKLKHLKKLNRIYRKLSTLSHLTVREFDESNHTISVKLIMREGGMRGCILYEPITMELEELGKDLDRAITHLEQHKEYSDMVQSWVEINKLVSEYNFKIPELVSYIEEQVRIKMRNTPFRQYHKDPNYGYHLDNITTAILDNVYDLGFKSEPFRDLNLRLLEMDKIYVQYSPVLQKGLYLIDAKKSDEKPDIKQIEELLIFIIKDRNVIEKSQPLNELLSKILYIIEDFPKKMEPLIKNIEKNNFVVEGKCDFTIQTDLCEMCYQEVGTKKHDSPVWCVYNGVLCNDCSKLIKSDTKIYDAEYISGPLSIVPRTKGYFAIQNFDEQIVFSTKSDGVLLVIPLKNVKNSEIIQQEKSTKKKIITLGFARESTPLLQINFTDNSSNDQKIVFKIKNFGEVFDNLPKIAPTIKKEDPAYLGWKFY